ncbi:MAG TPA: transglutaminase-like domain-containing protein [Candidatus Acidoferrales bacterium]|jgi:hypothetical protein|nr:transglutaminase-like domain-containing protein [Candidatus Acidoferrales bacterium]
MNSKSDGKSGLNRRGVALILLLAVFLGLSAGRGLAGVTTLYDSGFCFPTFSNAALVGQQGWENAEGYSGNAAQVVTCPVGLMVELFGPYAQAGGPNFYNSEFIQPLSNYDPVSAGTPIISVRAEARMNLGPTAGAANWLFGFLVLNDQNGTPYETIGIDKNGVVFGQNFNSPNQVVTATNSGTNGFHILRADLNFSTRQVTFYMDNNSMGSMPFNPSSSTQVGSVALVLQGSNLIDSNFFVDDVAVTAATAEIPGGACSMQIIKSGPCLGNGTYGIPNVGDLYGIRADFSVTGTPQPFRVRFTLGNVVWYTSYQSGITTGGDWWNYFDWWVNLDGPLPWSITLDPDGVSGSTNLANMTVSGTYTPTPPSVPLDLYNPVTYAGIEQENISFQPGSGTIPYLHVIFGSPTSHGGQQILSVNGPANAVSMITAPYGTPVFAVNYSNVPAGLFQPEVSFVARASSMRVNPGLLETNTWAGMSALPTNITQWLAPDQICQSTSPAISNFVSLYLPANYKTTMTPYDTARALQLAVERSLIYLEPPPFFDATNSLQAGVADCGGFASLFTAALRCAGIPARRIGGFWQSDTWQNYNNWHVRTESYFPNTGWVITDACEGNRADPTGVFS